MLLEEKGALADLSELLDEDVVEQIFPAVLQYGMAEDRLCGIVYQVNVRTLAVSKELCRSDAWNFRDVMAAMEAQAEEGKKAGWIAGSNSPAGMLTDLVLKDVAAGNSSLVDEKQKQCYFDTEEFIHVLEFCQKYGRSSEGAAGMTEEEMLEQIHGGQALAYPIWGSLRDLSRCLEGLGEGFQCIGYPTEGEYGSFVSCGNCLAVNEASENSEIARDFIQYLMGERIQRKLGMSTVRKDVLSGSVVEHWEGSPGPVVWKSGRTVSPMGAKPDGTSFLAEYREILDKGIVEPERENRILQIILEEAEAYFNRDKTAEAVAQVIQNRVSLYLNE